MFQNRFDGSQDFLKGWKDYECGFGNLAGEFWLGLDKLNYLTNQKLYELRIEMETQRGQEAYAGYSVFTVGPEQEGYRISTLGTFYGTAGLFEYKTPHIVFFTICILNVYCALFPKQIRSYLLWVFP